MAVKEMQKLEIAVGNGILVLNTSKDTGGVEQISGSILEFALQQPFNETIIVTTTSITDSPVNTGGSGQPLVYRITRARNAFNTMTIVEYFGNDGMTSTNAHVSVRGWSGWSTTSRNGSWTPATTLGSVTIERVPTVGSIWRRTVNRAYIQTELIVTPNDGFNGSAINLSGLPLAPRASDFLNIDTFPQIDNITASISIPTGQVGHIRIASWNFQRIPLEEQTRVRIYGSYSV